MFVESLKITKFLFFITTFFLGIYFIMEGNYILKDFNKKSNFIKISNNNKIIVEPNNNNSIELKLVEKIQSEIVDYKINKKIIVVKEGDTFSKILKRYIEEPNYRNKVINLVNKKFNLKNLNIKQKIIFYFDNKKKLNQIVIPLNFYNDLIVDMSQKEIDVYDKKSQYSIEEISSEFEINSSLYDDGMKSGLSMNVLADLIKLYSFDIDFQRDIKKKTLVKILYKKLFNQNSNTTSYSNIEYANIIIENKKIEYFFFETNEGILDYFNEDGKSVKKSLLKTPIDGAKLSSNFGMRKHPISGFNKLHKGVDFSAPKGTPIYAGGNGIIEYLGRNGGYGKYIRIRHNNGYKTAYAHLSNFKKNIYKGKRVNQGEVIGYLGSTGKSTGPHLHYEIIYNNKQINPMKMNLPSGKKLEGSELQNFKKNAQNIYAKYLFNLYE